MKCATWLAVYVVSIIGVAMSVPGEVFPTELVSGEKAVQLRFGDREGDPQNWPEPVFSDGFTPWREIALNFDAVAFAKTPNALGNVALHTTPWKDVNLPRGADGFGLDTYFATTRELAPDHLEAVVAMGTLLGGTLAGIDYTEPQQQGNSQNFVRLIKKWFSYDIGAGVFLNNVHARGGVDWWYDIYPNILACKLSDLYGSRADAPGEPSLSSLCETSIDRWREAVDYLRNGSDVPEFSFKAVQLVDGPVAGSKDLKATRFQPISACDVGERGYRAIAVARRPDPRQVCFGNPRYNGDIFESDSAGGFAYLGMLGYEKTHKPSDRQLAEWSLTYLDRAEYNPLYENLLPYGALAAARLNAELGDKHDLQKYLGWIFSTSSVRKEWGMIGKDWGRTPAFGLVGARKTGREGVTPNGPDYAFSFDTMDFAATIAPIPRYNPATANEIGKYLYHVAHNSRFFYPAYLSYMDPTTEKYIRDANSPKLNLSLPFEGLKSKFPGQVEKQPFGTGDALKDNRKGAYRTDLSVYSGGSAGAMARLFIPTTVENIYQIDLNADDIPTPTAFPSYLVYNPYEEIKLVPLRVDSIRKGNSKLATDEFFIYDAVNKAIVARHVTNSVSVRISPHQAVVLVAVPESDTLEATGPLLIARHSGIIVDYARKSN